MPTISVESKGSSEQQIKRDVTELADAHCHLDMVAPSTISDAILSGVRTIITNGVDTQSNIKAYKLSDGRNIFPTMGVDPEHAILMDDKELEMNLKMARSSPKIVGIGEIGIDKGGRIGNLERQIMVFKKFVDLALELHLPISIHSRNALEDVLSILEAKDVLRAHIHFFEGDAQQARRIERLGYIISIPPLESNKRRKVINEISIDNIMVESDSPAAVKSPKDVRKAVEMIAEEKRIDFERAAETVVKNTKRFFNISSKPTMMRN